MFKINGDIHLSEIRKLQALQKILKSKKLPLIKMVSPVNCQSIIGLNAIDKNYGISTFYEIGINSDNIRFSNIRGLETFYGDILFKSFSFLDVDLKKSKVMNISASHTGFLVANKHGLSDSFLNTDSDKYGYDAKFFVEMEDKLFNMESFFRPNENALSEIFKYHLLEFESQFKK